ncbi:DVU_1556 family methyltransferase [Desulfomonile tiedjei]|nr:class I SAM-dependent methyltransferase [Desulfomonile tiedjei]
MSSLNSCRVYERLAETECAAEGIRPGGLALTERAVALCGFPQGSRIVDVGCGTGVTLRHLTGVHRFSAIGVDASSHLLHQACFENHDLLFVRSIAERLPFPDAFADGIFAECSLSTMNDPERALDEFQRLLKIGGKLIITDVYARNAESSGQLSCMPVECCLKGAVSRTNLLERLSCRDFRIDLWEDHSDLLTRFVVHLVFSYGSMDEFWSRMGLKSVDLNEMNRTISEAKPGYFLLIAQKTT